MGSPGSQTLSIALAKLSASKLVTFHNIPMTQGLIIHKQFVSNQNKVFANMRCNYQPAFK